MFDYTLILEYLFKKKNKKTQKQKTQINGFGLDMVNQNKICSFKINRQAKCVFPGDVEKTAGKNVLSCSTFAFLA